MSKVSKDPAPADLADRDSGDETGPVTPTTTTTSAPVAPTADQRVALIYQGPGVIPGIPKRNLTVADLVILVGNQGRADRISGPGAPYRRTVAYPTDLPVAQPRKG